MAYLRASIKLIVFFILMFGFALVSFFWKLTTKDSLQRRRRYAWTTSQLSRLCLKLMNVTVNVKNYPALNSQSLLISNHLGMIDILLKCSVQETLFITSYELKEAPGLGALTEMGGCLYVERRSRANIHREIENIRETLLEGFNVVLYPEGMSTNGEKVHPFKKSLLMSVAGTGIPIVPVCLSFRKVNGEDMHHKWRDHVCWYGDQSFPPALWRLLQLQSIDAELHFFDPMYVHNEEERRAVAELAHRLISSHYQGILTPDESELINDSGLLSST